MPTLPEQVEAHLKELKAGSRKESVAESLVADETLELNR